MKLLERSAIVTGAAGGIGEAIAVAFAEAGARVAVVDIDGAGAERVAARIRGGGAQAITLQCDVAESMQVRRMIQTVDETFGGIDILVANAGIMDRAPLLETPMATFDRIMAVNVRGAFECSVRAAGVMAGRRRPGVIIHVTSIEDGRGTPTSGVPYSTSKGAQRAMVAASAVHLAADGIRVVGLAPGMVPSGLNNHHPRGDQSRIPAGRPGSPREIAQAAVFLASDDASYVNGTTLYVDGGWTASV